MNQVNNEDFELLGQMVHSLKSEMKHYFERYEQNTNLIISTFLDPRHKRRFWPDPSNLKCSVTTISRYLHDAYDDYASKEFMTAERNSEMEI